jgi:hypothetical protein
MTHDDIYQSADQPNDGAGAHAPAKPSRRGQNLSLADRARGGHNSAKQQRRDRTGRFAGSTKKTSKPATAQNAAAEAPAGEREAA